MPDFVPKPDGELVAFGDRVVAAMEADEAAYGVTAAQSADLRAKLTAFRNSLASSEAAKAAARTAVAAKDVARDDFERTLRDVVKVVQVNSAVTDASRTAAGLPVHDTVRTSSAPVAPRDLVAVADAAGNADLKFNGNGNSSGARFVVQKKAGSSLEFVNVDVITATSLRVSGLVVGQRCEFRVLARRGKIDSAPSNTASIF